jgi:hypothetical protein
MYPVVITLIHFYISVSLSSTSAFLSIYDNSVQSARPSVFESSTYIFRLRLPAQPDIYAESREGRKKRDFIVVELMGGLMLTRFLSARQERRRRLSHRQIRRDCTHQFMSSSWSLSFCSVDGGIFFCVLTVLRVVPCAQTNKHVLDDLHRSNSIILC